MQVCDPMTSRAHALPRIFMCFTPTMQDLERMNGIHSRYWASATSRQKYTAVRMPFFLSLRFIFNAQYNDKAHYCPVCFNAYVYLACLQTHMKAAHGVEVSKEQLQDTASPQVNEVQAQICKEFRASAVAEFVRLREEERDKKREERKKKGKPSRAREESEESGESE